MQLFPLPQPPADEVAELLDELRVARRELRDAGRIVHMLKEPFPGNPGRLGRLRLFIEQDVAERRCERWAAEVARLEAQGRQLGLDVAPQS